jgi:Rieske 2Fe-2S family protein
MTTIETTSETPRGTALDPRLYVDPAALEREHEAIFARSWQLAGHVSDLPRNGSYLVGRVGSESVLVIRGEDGELRAFRNVCRHRATVLREGRGDCGKALRCPYHGWTYRPDGSLIGVPEGRGFAGLDKSALGLMPARVECFAGFVFVAIDPDIAPLRDGLAGLEEKLAPYGIERLTRFSESTSKQPANWKIVADNYLEGYHIPIAHPGLMRLLDYQGYDVEVGDGYVWFEAPLRAKPSGNRIERIYQKMMRPMPDLPAEYHRTWRYAYIYPNTTIDLYPDQVTTWQINPDGPKATHDVYACYRAERPSAALRATQRLNHRLNWEVGDEDAELVRRVQAGMATRGWTPGPLGEREAAVAWFADCVRRDLEVAAA